MQEYQGKDQKSGTYASAAAVTQRKKNGGARGFSLVDNRQASAQMQAKMPEMSGSKSEGQVLQAKGFNKVRQFKAEYPVQKQANRTGLPDDLKAGVENLSGLAMDDVRVHYNSDKPAQLQAHAYTQGADIHVAPGQEKHLPHEAWHVVQQKQGRVQPTMQMAGGVAVNDDKGLEGEAEINGAIAHENGRLSMNERRLEVRVGQAHPSMPPDFLDRLSSGVDKQNQVASGDSDVMQCAKIRRRPLGGVGSVDGNDAHIRKHGLYHEHIFFDDDAPGQISNVGFGPHGLFSEINQDKYKDSHTGRKADREMRLAVQAIQPGKYNLLNNNCQHYVSKVHEEYLEQMRDPSGNRNVFGAIKDDDL